MTSKTYGTLDPEQRKSMSGLEFVQGLVSGAVPLNTIARTLGYDIVEAESGRVVITLAPTGDHLNPSGTVHGGLTATLLDSCMGLAIQSMLEPGLGSTTLEFKISLVSVPSQRRPARSRPRAKCSIAAAESARRKAASRTSKADYWRMARRRAWFSPPDRSGRRRGRNCRFRRKYRAVPYRNSALHHSNSRRKPARRRALRPCSSTL